MLSPNLDLDVLRSLVAAIDLGGFGRAAAKLGRSQSAVSLQMQRLEAQFDRPLFRKEGRRLALTDAGDTVLAYARRLLALNDEAVAAVRGSAVEGSVRLGVVQDLADSTLAPVLARFARAHPAAHVEVRVERSVTLLDHLANGRLDLAVTFTRAGSDAVIELPLAWIATPDFVRERDQPLPLVLFEAPCFCRQAAIEALDAAGIPWRIALTSPSLAGLWAAVSAGLGVGVRTTHALPPGLVPIEAGLPRLPKIGFALRSSTAPLSPAAMRLREIVAETLTTRI
ncbi:MAG: LysR family transcriptional regulator [Rhodospirillaceae bacterium]|nr:LysR family transcriptional regulator [Rhodospirillaceae bacterium]